MYPKQSASRGRPARVSSATPRSASSASLSTARPLVRPSSSNKSACCSPRICRPGGDRRPWAGWGGQRKGCSARPGAVGMPAAATAGVVGCGGGAPQARGLVIVATHLQQAPARGQHVVPGQRAFIEAQGIAARLEGDGAGIGHQVEGLRGAIRGGGGEAVDWRAQQAVGRQRRLRGCLAAGAAAAAAPECGLCYRRRGAGAAPCVALRM